MLSKLSKFLGELFDYPKEFINKLEQIIAIGEGKRTIKKKLLLFRKLIEEYEKIATKQYSGLLKMRQIR